MLSDIISNEQTGFMENRFIGDNTRFTYDLIHSLKKANRIALFLSLDIQDAFNSVNPRLVGVFRVTRPVGGRGRFGSP